MKKIILATTSPYRQEAFKMIGVEFEAIGSGVEEKFEKRPTDPEELVRELARQKTQSVAQQCEEGLIVGFDSVGWFKNEILEKPKSLGEATKRLKMLSGKKFNFHTGVFMIDVENNKQYHAVITTEVQMRILANKEIERYLSQDKKFNTYALGFDPLGHYSSTFVKEIKGSYNNLLRGIPIEHIMEMFKEAGIVIK